jgi:hypothetical protein
MKTAIIQLEADRIDWAMPVQQPDGSMIQRVRLYEGNECRVELVANFHKDTIEAKEWAMSAGRIKAAKIEEKKPQIDYARELNLNSQRIRAGIARVVSKA